MYDRLINKLN